MFKFLVVSFYNTLFALSDLFVRSCGFFSYYRPQSKPIDTVANRVHRSASFLRSSLGVLAGKEFCCRLYRLVEEKKFS